MFERFTEAARTAVVAAQEQARQVGADHIGAEHVLVGVLSDRGGAGSAVLGRLGIGVDEVAARAVARGSLDGSALAALGIDLGVVRRRVEATFGSGALDRQRGRRGLFGRRARGAGFVAFTAEAKEALELSLREAVDRSHRSITSGHLLLGLLATRHQTVPDLLQSLGMTCSTEELRRLLRIELDRAA